jgi:acetamidase/formamidase
MNDRISFPLRPMVGVIGVATDGDEVFNGFAGRHGGNLEEGARFLVEQWGFSMEEAFIFLSVACDANICQACRPQEFSTIARVSSPKVSATPRPFS